MRILLVDDHPLIHEALALILESHPDGVAHEAASGFAEACNRLAMNPAIDLVLLDLGLPGFSGIGALTQIRERFADIPVVVVSSNEDPDVIHASLEAGAMGFIPKTFKPDAIRMALRYVAAGGVFVPHQVLNPNHGGRELADKDDSAPVSDERVRERLGLTRRQFDVLKLLVCGMTNKRIAEKLDLSDNTVKAHVAAVLRTLDASNRTQAVVLASRYGMRAVN